MKAAKAWYFCYFASLSCLFPFLNLFFRRLGLSERQIGAIGAARPFISLPAGSIWSGAADKSRRHRAVLLFTFAASGLARLAIAAVGSRGFAAIMAAVLLTEFFSAPVTIIVDSAVMAACAEQGTYGRQRLFGALGWGLFSAVSGSTISHAGIYAAFVGHAVLAAVTTIPTLQLPFGPLHARLAKQASLPEEAAGGGGSSLGDGSNGSGKEEGEQQQEEQQEQQRRRQGQQGEAQGQHAAVGPCESPRGSMGAVARFDSALEVQSLLHHTVGSSKAGLQSVPAPPQAAATASSGSGSDLGSADSSRAADAGGGQLKLQQQAQQQRHERQQQPRLRYWQGVLQLLRDPEATVFLAMAVVMGFGVGNIEGYLFLYLDELGGSELLMGLSLSVTCAAESLVFFFLPQILAATGIRRCMHLVFAAFLLRMGCYSVLQYMPSPWMVLPVEVLHGITFALAWGGGCAYCEQLSPPGLEATTQGLFQGLYFGLGVGAGSFVGGHVYQVHGAQVVYLVACAVLASGWLLCALAQLALSMLGVGRSQERYLRVAALELNELNEVAVAVQT